MKQAVLMLAEHAAMEPAEDRPEDAIDRDQVMALAMAPQWSRPRIGRRTLYCGPDSAWAVQPQWSRPRIGRRTW